MKILVPVDDSECCQRTLQWVSSLLDKSVAQYYLLHVIPKPNAELMIEAYEIEDAVKLLEKDKAFLLKAGCKVAAAEFDQGDPAPKICDYADAIHADLIVMGSHGRSALSRLLYGSISQGVLEHSRQPVFFYKNLLPQPAHHA